MPTTNSEISQAIETLVAKTSKIKFPDGLQEKLNEIFSHLKISSKSEDTFW